MKREEPLAAALPRIWLHLAANVQYCQTATAIPGRPGRLVAGFGGSLARKGKVEAVGNGDGQVYGRFHNGKRHKKSSIQIISLAQRGSLQGKPGFSHAARAHHSQQTTIWLV